MEDLPYSHIEKGTLLISTPEIDTGLFFRSVILVCEHTPEGSFGLVINKSLDLELPQDIINVEQMANPRIGVRASGPVQTNQMMLLHTQPEIPDQTLEVCQGVYLGGNLEFLQQGIVNPDGPHIYLCFGYSGWGGGQLEREFLDGSWLIYPGSEDLIFGVSHEKLWQTLLRKMGGKYATLSMIPEDLSLN